MPQTLQNPDAESSMAPGHNPPPFVSIVMLWLVIAHSAVAGLNGAATIDNIDGAPTRDGDEIKTGTNPLDASSFIRLTPQKSGGSFLLTWRSVPGALI